MSRLRAYAQLVRLPNVFTALADICLGALAAGALPEQWPAFAFLLPASAFLYCGGMVWNDFFDIEQDRKERPFRPLPSGKISRAAAGRLGVVLLAAGLVFAVVAGWRADGFRWTSTAIAAALVATILLYDGWLKRTWAGPLGMGTCRFLNVLLGLSAGLSVFGPMEYHLALTVGVYIIGVTWFARTEAQTSDRSSLRAAAWVMLYGLVIAVAVPVWLPPETSSPLFPYLLVGLGFWVGIPVARAAREPKPSLVQAAVKRAIFGLVVLDAVLATAVVGAGGMILTILVVPAHLLGKRVYST